ncbi:peptidoglycan editing factor PgeF [Lacimicrobium sp. SS2-24]|uniref:peptidoglycan editing factor PgeF n=1 Tax=Lacimicrobium sp. SS2-24 TaxID=2005569 RepID=UPI000B4BCB99|nr:peptidoglycan editing factor PgeF [Lacimicrobium sp. SS2-24]
MITTESPHLIIPDWPAPANVRAVSTTRECGFSQAPYRSFNLALHVGDKPERVLRNRQMLPASQQIIWLSQVHGNDVVTLEPGSKQQQKADASITTVPGVSCAVMTADCLAVLFCHKQGKAVAAAHAGWRGLASGVLENTLKRLPGSSGDYLVWLGPAIGQKAFEVGAEVKKAFPESPSAFVKTSGEGKYLADIYTIASERLRRAGVAAIFGKEQCTFSNPAKFFSYRREGITGRMASLIWLTDSAAEV